MNNNKSVGKYFSWSERRSSDCLLLRSEPRINSCLSSKAFTVIDATIESSVVLSTLSHESLPRDKIKTLDWDTMVMFYPQLIRIETGLNSIGEFLVGNR
jgi:hypothetical protein